MEEILMMKTFGRVAYEAHEEFNEEVPAGYVSWSFIDQSERDAWDVTAQAVIEEYERRRDDERQEGRVI